MGSFMRDSRGSAVQWFALAAVVLSVASVAGAHTLDWLSQSGHVALMAYRAPATGTSVRARAEIGVDPMPTGSIPPNALVIRIR